MQEQKKPIEVTTFDASDKVRLKLIARAVRRKKLPSNYNAYFHAFGIDGWNDPERGSKAIRREMSAFLLSLCGRLGDQRVQGRLVDESTVDQCLTKQAE